MLNSYFNNKVYQLIGSIFFAAYAVLAGTLGLLDPPNPDDIIPWEEATFQAIGFLALDGFNVEHPNLALHAARTVAILFVLNSVSAIFIGTLGNQLRIHFAKKPIILFGSGWKGRKVAESLVQEHKEKGRIIVVDRFIDPVFEHWCRSHGIGVVIGDAMLEETLIKAKVPRAKKIYVFCGDDETNLQIAHQASEIIDAQHKILHPVKCYLELASSGHASIPGEVISKDSLLKPHILNVENVTARLLLDQSPVDSFTADHPAEVLHAVVIGTSAMSNELIRLLMHVCHFETPKRLHLTLVVENIATAKQDFLTRYPIFEEDGAILRPRDHWIRSEHILPDVSFCELNFNHLPNVHWQTKFKNIIIPEELKDIPQITSIFVAIDNGVSSSVFAASASAPLANFARTYHPIQLYFYVPTGDESFTTSIEKGVKPNNPSAYPIKCVAFEDFLSTQSMSAIEGQRIEEFAKQLHHAFSKEHETEKTKEQYWEEALEIDKESSRMATLHASYKIRINQRQNILAGDPQDELARVEHKRWCAELFLKGFRPLTDFPSANREEGKTYHLTEDDKIKICQWFGWQGQANLKNDFRKVHYHLDLMPYDEIKSVIDSVGTPEAHQQAEVELQKDRILINTVLESKLF